jgi:hypothetical protein
VHGLSASVDQAVSGAAVGAAGRAGFLDRKVDPGVGIPESLLRSRTGKRQIRAADFVFLFFVGVFELVIGGVGRMRHGRLSRSILGFLKSVGVF